MSFQTQVNVNPAPAIEGDFASANPHASVLAYLNGAGPEGSGGGALVAGADGVIVGRFAYALNADGTVGNAKVANARIGFVGREQSGAMITAFLGSATMTVLAGYEVTLYNAGDFWGRFAAGATIGDKVYAVDADGTLASHAAGTVVAGQTETNWYVQSAAGAGELAMISSRP